MKHFSIWILSSAKKIKNLLRLFCKPNYSFVAINFWCFSKNAHFHFYISKELTDLWKIFLMGLSKKDLKKKILTNIHQKFISLFHLYIISKYSNFDHFFNFSTIFSNNHHGQGDWPCINTYPTKLSIHTYRYKIFCTTMLWVIIPKWYHKWL